MRAGSLRHLVLVQRPVTSQSDYGEAITEWQDVLATNAAISPLSAREYFSTQQTQADVTHKVTLRYSPGVLPNMRLLFGSRILQIAAVIDGDERHVELELLCKEAI